MKKYIVQHALTKMARVVEEDDIGNVESSWIVWEDTKTNGFLYNRKRGVPQQFLYKYYGFLNPGNMIAVARELLGEDYDV